MKEKKLKTKKYLINKYHIDTRKIKEALEIIKQQIITTAKKISRYKARIAHHRQNVQFLLNQELFYQSPSGETIMNEPT